MVNLTPGFDTAIRRATTLARRLIDRTFPASVSERATGLGRRSKQMWHERKRNAFSDDAAYFDHVVAEAIAEGNQATHGGRV